MHTSRSGSDSMNDMNSQSSSRSFLSGFIREIAQVAAEFKKSYAEVQHEVEQAIAFEDLPIASTYPRELFEEDAKKLGINIDEIGEKEAIKRIVMLQFEREKEKKRPQSGG
jgi:deoxyxylulose-5-phosphate synthase